MSKVNFLDSAKQCCENSQRLLDEAEVLECEQVPATRYYLSVISQEESAKAFLLYLVSVSALSWTPFLLRATRDHRCKQLVGIILDYIAPDTDEFIRRLEAWKLGGAHPPIPSMVADAMNLLRYEKIRRWESKDWWWAEDPQYDEVALGVSEGKRDREKQRALYVELCQNGEVAAIPEEVTVKQTNEEYERTRRIVSSVQNLLKNSLTPDWDYERVESCFRALFSNVNDFIDSQENEKT